MSTTDTVQTIISAVGEVAERTGLLRSGDSSWDATTNTLTIEMGDEDEETAAVREQVFDRLLQRRCVTLAFPDATALLPSVAQFRDAGGYQVDFILADDVERIATALIARCEEFAHLASERVAYLWRKKKQVKANNLVLGTCQKLTGLPQAFVEADWAIIINRENCATCNLTNWQLEALVYHELCHIGTGDPENEVPPALVGHDFEAFGAEVRRYGLWQSDLQAAKAAFDDLPLFAGLGQGE